jgi:hypothetical protein
MLGNTIMSNIKTQKYNYIWEEKGYESLTGSLTRMRYARTINV